MIIVRRQAMEWEKIHAAHIACRRPVPRIYIKTSKKSMSKNQIIQKKNGQKTCTFTSQKRNSKWSINI